MRLRLGAPAKLNLALEVVGRRADGYHELVSVVQCISLADRLEVAPAEDLVLQAPPDLGPAEGNLAYRAARALARRAGVELGARIRLTKRIPVGAGLGGGSTDAAAALRLLARLWALEPGSVHLAELAAEVGSDVPLFLAGPAALVRGRGERVRALPPLRGAWFVLVVPPWTVPDKTARVFGALQPEELGTGERAGAVATMVEAGRWPSPDALVNDLRASAGRVFPGLAELEARLAEATNVRFALSGAGPTLFALAASRREAERCAARASGLGAAAVVARALHARSTIRSA